jgi:hypothetical protein
MRKQLLTLTLLLAVGFAAGEPWLCRVEGMSGREAAAAGIPVVMELPGYCLAWLEPGAFSGNPSVRALEPDQPRRCWLYVMPDPRLDRSLLARLGTVLTEDAEGVVLSTAEENILSLNTLQVELAGIGKEPMRFDEPMLVPEPAAIPDSLIWHLVGRVSTDSLEASLRRLIAFRTRYATTESCRSACEWMRSRLATFGCDSTYLDTFLTGYAPNVVGVRTGVLNPRRVFVISGHIDNTSDLPPNNCPGSDDNASGTGLPIEACRVFSDMDFDNTVWFVGFSAEEQGLWGSDSFVHACRLRGDSIVAAIHSDMISYARDDSATIVYNNAIPQTESLAHYFMAQADTFTNLNVKDTVITTAMSDHYSFWKYGYAAIRNRYHDRSPQYHKIGDTIGPFHYINCGTNNLPLYTEVVKATVATLAKWAGAHPAAAIKETMNDERGTLNPGPTIGRGSLFLSPSLFTLHSSLFDSNGRKVAELRSGPNDVSGLVQGVYFVREQSAASGQQSGVSGVRRVVLVR